MIKHNLKSQTTKREHRKYKEESALCTKYEQTTKDKAVKHHQRQGRIKQPSCTSLKCKHR
jgi:hypothetical protein